MSVSFGARDRSPAGAARERTPGRPASRRARCSSPSTLTYTRAWLRSGLVSTEVKVTKPMRGSLKPSAMRADRTSRTASFTLRMRSVATLVQVLRRYESAFHASAVRKHSPHVAFDLRGSILEQAGVAADERGRQTRPAATARDARSRPPRRRSGAGAEPSGRKLPALALQAAVLGKMQVDREDTDEGGHIKPASAPPASSRTPRSRPPPSRRGSSRARCRTPCPRSPRGRRP